ncbi:hypothetical protein GQ457_04G011000 [Hibiscus cannabinus]
MRRQKNGKRLVLRDNWQTNTIGIAGLPCFTYPQLMGKLVAEAATGQKTWSRMPSKIALIYTWAKFVVALHLMLISSKTWLFSRLDLDSEDSNNNNKLSLSPAYRKEALNQS